MVIISKVVISKVVIRKVILSIVMVSNKSYLVNFVIKNPEAEF